MEKVNEWDKLTWEHVSIVFQALSRGYVPNEPISWPMPFTAKMINESWAYLQKLGYNDDSPIAEQPEAPEAKPKKRRRTKK